MASVSNLMNSSSSTSSIYGSRNVLSGLASGMDTEALIENCIKSYQTKIAKLQQQQTKVTWKQDAYRSITDKLLSISQKYTSYTSKTNLSSRSFFLNSVNTTTNGTNASKVSATGRTNSDIKLNAVKQLASAARYSVEADVLKTKESIEGMAVNFSENVQRTNISGDITLTVGANKVTLSFGEDEVVKDADELADAINKKLAEEELGKDKASSRVKAVNYGGTIRFETIGESKSAGDAVWISSAYGDIKDTLGITAGTLGKGDSTLSVKGKDIYHEVDRKQYLSNKTVEIKMGDKTATVKLSNVANIESDNEAANVIFDDIKSKVWEVFGDKLTVECMPNEKDGTYSFKFTTTEKDADGNPAKVEVTSSVGDALGFGTSGLSNALSTSSTLGQAFGKEFDSLCDDSGVFTDPSKWVDSEDVDQDKIKYLDKEGNEVKKQGDDWYRVDSKGNITGKPLKEEDITTTGVDKDGNQVIYKQGAWYRKSDKAELVINGVNVGSFDRNSTIEDVLNKINSSEAGVRASYSKLTNKFVFTANETGSEGKIEISGALGEKLFGKTEVGRAEVYTKVISKNETTGTERGLLTDSEGNALVAGKDENGNNYYILANKSNGETKYYKALESGKLLSTEAIDVNSITDILKQARKGYEEGKDAIYNITVNGDTVTKTSKTNVVDMDGLTVTFNDVFNNDKDANGVNFFNDDEKMSLNKSAKLERDSIVTFTTKADADKILEAVQDFIKDFNEISTQVRTEYSTQPMKNSKKRNYEPLTDEDRKDMTEDQIKEYEEKAKTGLLFGDTDLSGLHNSLRNAITPSGDLRKAMSEIGLTVKYEGGITTLSLDESKFRAALDKDITAVQKVFTSSTENGDSYDGLMERTKKTINTYASTSIGSYGVLVRKAGTKSKSLTLRDNTLQKQYNNLEDQIERWQNKMSDKVDYYTRQFTQLEKLMNQMNSQSSTLAGLTGGY